MITKDMAPCSMELLNAVLSTAHTLIAGATGSGKSVLLNTLIYSLLKMKPGNVETDYFVMIDPKRVELKMYKNCQRVVGYFTEPEDIPGVLDGVIDIMDTRYEEMEGRETTEPAIYVIIDELADLLDTYGVLERIVKIGRLGRAAHIHLICCTQDPSRRTLSAQLMQNFTTCIALRCRDVIESRQIIRKEGAERLPRYGKAILSNENGLKTISIPLTPDKDIKQLLEAIDIADNGTESIEKVIEPSLLAEMSKYGSLNEMRENGVMY